MAGKIKRRAKVQSAKARKRFEKLEYEAAIRAANEFALPNSMLLQLAVDFPPPPEWFHIKEEKPF